ncbi:MAG: right-handed parallel beta-helix repeat-containing protein [Abditibacteriota bacterium]|nr:right-handed parallel beta-helix repeat-containing protein [Abditibacteriota bacterium]
MKKIVFLLLISFIATCSFALTNHPENDRLPVGDVFYSWESSPVWSKTYHVACENKNANDKNPGTKEKPWKTINHAAQVLKAGERVIIHKGTYRETINPINTGESSIKMIGFFGAEGEKVIVKGSFEWKPDWSLETGCFVAPIPDFLKNSQFDKVNMVQDPGKYNFGFPPKCDYGYNLKRGQLFLKGKRIPQVLKTEELKENTFCIEAGKVFYIPSEGINPIGQTFEASAREQLFTPKNKFSQYIIVSGISFLHCANGAFIPTPQKGAVSTYLGNHFIIENCEIGHCNATGMDIGGQWWEMAEGQPLGNNIVRNCHIYDCGITGICGWHAGCNQNILIEDNLIENIGYLPLFEHCEIAGIKLHRVMGSIVRRNIIRNIDNGPGIWFDGWVSNSRVTQNLVYNCLDKTFGGVFMEISPGPVLIDNNIILNTDINGIHSTDADKLYIVQNIVANAKSGTLLDIYQGDKARFNPPGLVFEDEHFICGNILTGGVRYTTTATKYSVIDYNLYGPLLSMPQKGEGDSKDINEEGEIEKTPFLMQSTSVPENNGRYDFIGWQEKGFDKNSKIEDIKVDFDEDNLTIALTCPKDLNSFVMPLSGCLVNNQVFAYEFIQNDFLGNSRLSKREPILSEDIIGYLTTRELTLGPIKDMKFDGTKYKVDPRNIK